MSTSLGSAVLELEVDSAALKKGMASAKSDVNQSLKDIGMAMTVAGAAGVAAFGLAAKAALGYGASASFPQGWAGRFLGAAESFMGVFMMALFLVTFTRKMTR